MGQRSSLLRLAERSPLKVYQLEPLHEKHQGVDLDQSTERGVDVFKPQAGFRAVNSHNRTVRSPVTIESARDRDGLIERSAEWPA
jgi:hypothetical protein